MKFIIFTLVSILVMAIVFVIFLLSSFSAVFISLLLLLFVFILLFFLSALWPPDSPWSFEWRTDKKTADQIVKFGNIGPKSIVYDLGCGDGEVLIACAKNGALGVGIEIDPLRYWVSRIRAKHSGVTGNLKFIRGSFFDQDISKANVVIVYLIPKTLDRLLPKFKKELKKGTIIISFGYEMRLKPTKVDKKNKLFLYTI